MIFDHHFHLTIRSRPDRLVYDSRTDEPVHHTWHDLACIDTYSPGGDSGSPVYRSDNRDPGVVGVGLLAVSAPAGPNEDTGKHQKASMCYVRVGDIQDALGMRLALSDRAGDYPRNGQP